MKRFTLALLCATGLNAEIYIYNTQTELPIVTAEKPFIASHEIGNIAFATSRGDNGDIKSLNTDGVPLSTIELIRKKVLINSAPVAKKVVSTTAEKKPASVVIKPKQPSTQPQPNKFKL